MPSNGATYCNHLVIDAVANLTDSTIKTQRTSNLFATYQKGLPSQFEKIAIPQSMDLYQAIWADHVNKGEVVFILARGDWNATKKKYDTGHIAVPVPTTTQGESLEGGPGSGRSTVVRVVAGQLDRRTLIVDGASLSGEKGAVQEQVLSVATRMSEAFGDIVCVRDAKRLQQRSATAAALARFVRRRDCAVVLLSNTDEPMDPAVEREVLLRRRHETPSGAEEVRVWQVNLPQEAELPLGELAELPERVRLSPHQVNKAVRLASLSPDGISAAGLERAARAQMTQSIGGLARVVEPVARIDDLVLDDPTLDRVQEVIAAGRARRMVLSDWGLGRRISRGTGIIALFDGEPGTGKTHAAEAIAGELGLSLVHINTASVVDKYIGETEKNLSRIFERVRPEVSLMLFDEADALFSKRTSVERSTDRYSNMDVNVLLQLVERFPGIAVLTTNLKSSIDKAFERRITFKVTFDLPKVEERMRLWQYLLPSDVMTGEPIDFERVADVELSGGEIKNAILLGAYMAARTGSLMRTEHLLEAAQREAAAAGRAVRLRRKEDW